jgi:hypothetical protein
MPNRRLLAVPLAAVIALAAAACAGCDDRASGDDAPAAKASPRSEKKNGGNGGKRKDEKPRFKLGRIDHNAIGESSGIIGSRKHAGVFWTHNDSGNGPFVFAITREGKFIAEYPVAGVRNTDWEAITADDAGQLYIGDIGNNDGKRDRLLVYRLAEPDPAAAGPRGRGMALKVNAIYRLKYPDKPFDSESLFVHQGKGYVISKQINGKQAGVYRFDLAAPGADAAPLEHVCDLPIRSPVTDAAISPDGKQLAVLTVTGPNLFQLNGDVASAANAVPKHVTYFDPQDLNMEGVCFVEEGLLATTEQGQMLLFAYEHFE